MAERIQVQGLCRFSFPANLEAFQTRHETMEDRRAALYAPARLDQRLLWFRHLALPSIRAQIDGDFTLHLLMGEDFPDPWRAELMDMVATVPQIRPHFRETGNHRLIYRDILTGARDPEADLVAEFRLDDDDAVAVNFVAQIRRNFAKIRPLFEAKGRFALDQGKGILVRAEADGVTCEGVISQYWAAGLALYLKPDDPACITDFPHQKVWMRMPALSLTDQVMFLRGAHDGNDSPVTTRGAGAFEIGDDELTDLISRRFGLDFEAFQAAIRARGTGA